MTMFTLSMTDNARYCGVKKESGEKLASII